MVFKHKKKIIFILIVILIIFFPTYTPKIRDEHSRVIKNSIAELSKVELGGTNQSIMIRRNNKDNPILLFLHGGPGYSFISYARNFFCRKESVIIVVGFFLISF